MKLNVKAFALTCGILWSISIFCLTWWIIAFDGSSSDPNFISTMYRGYTVSPAGSIIGFFWALGDGLIGGAIFAWLYNLISTRCVCNANNNEPAS